MLDRTFVHIPGVGAKSELDLWSRGVQSWADVDALASKNCLSRKVRERILASIPASQAALKRGDAGFFSRLSAIGESWRTFGAFSDRCVFIDVETTGLSPVFNTLTVVGLYDGSEYRVFIDGQNLHELPSVLKQYAVCVTFNGAQFDLRFLKATFPEIELPPIHIDLRWVTRRLGMSGGLKQVEGSFGIRRPAEINDVTGFDATVLWSKYLRGDSTALDRLIQYNTQDVVNLNTIMRESYARLMQQTGCKTKLKKPWAKQAKGLPRCANAVETVFRGPSHRNVVRGLRASAERLGRGSRIVGIDLTGSEKRATGWALLDADRATTDLISRDEDLFNKTVAAKPDLVSIDSPLSLPGGKASISEWEASSLPIYRSCELALKRMGISVFWCLLPSMKSLTLRGMRLASKLREAGIPVIESYPGAAQDLLRIPRKGTSLDELKWGLSEAGIGGAYVDTKTSHDEVDAITSALVGLFYAADEHIALGNALEDYLIVPKSPQIDYLAVSRILADTGLDPLEPNATSSALCA